MPTAPRPTPPRLARLAGAAGLCAMLLAGCAHPSRTASPPALDTASLDGPWLQAAGTTAQAPEAEGLARWWRQFEDPALDALIAQAWSRHTDVRAARAALDEARAARAAAEAGAGPQAGLDASASRNRSSGRTSTSSSLGFSASWEPDFFGERSASLSAAEAAEQASWADLATTRMTLSAEVALAYVSWRGTQAQRALTAASLARLESTLQLVDWRHRAGLANALDVEQARLSVQQSRASLQALDTTAAQSLHQLALLTGRTPQALSQASLAPADGAVPSAPAALRQIDVGVPADLLRRRPDLRASEARLRAQWAQREATRLGGRPALSLSGSLGLQALSMAALSGGGGTVAALAAAIQWPVFDGGQRSALLAQDDAALRRVQAGFESTVLTAVKDVEDALVALRGAQSQADALAQGVAHAEEVLRLTGQQQAAGLVDLRTLLSAERDLIGTQSSLQTARTTVSQQLIRLFKALGGGWSEADLAPASPPAPTR